MDNLMGVQVFETSEDAGCKKPGLKLGKLMFLADVVPEVASGHQIHEQIQILPILEGLPHVDDELVLDFGQKFPLIGHRVHALLGHYPELAISYTALDISFIAYTCPLFLSSTFHTLPKPPFPITC